MENNCYFCESNGSRRWRKGIELHHIDLNPKNNNPKNLVSLCQICHMKLHKTIYNRLKRVGMITQKEKEVNLKLKMIENAKNQIIKTLDSLK